MKLLLTIGLILSFSFSFSKDRGGDSGNGGNTPSAEFVAYLKLGLEIASPVIQNARLHNMSKKVTRHFMDKLLTETTIIPTSNKLCPETTDLDLVKDLQVKPFEIKVIEDTCTAHDGLAAKNWPKHKLIIFNLEKWNQLDDNEKMTLALHETLGLIQIEEGHYIYSSNIIFENLKDIVLQNKEIKSIFEKELKDFHEIRQLHTNHMTLYSWKPIETITLKDGEFSSSKKGHLIPACPTPGNLYNENYRPKTLVFHPMLFAAQSKECYLDNEKYFPKRIKNVIATMDMYTLKRQAYSIDGEVKYYRLRLGSNTSDIYCSQKNNLEMICLEKNSKRKEMKIVKYAKMLDPEIKKTTLNYGLYIFNDPELLNLMP